LSAKFSPLKMSHTRQTRGQTVALACLP